MLKTTETNKTFFPNLSRVSWKSIEQTISHNNYYIVNLIKKIKSLSNYTLYKARYPYGANIIKKGELYLPTENGKLISIHDNNIPTEIKRDLSYSYIPLGLFLNSYGETYIDMKEQNFPLIIFPPGEFFGLWEVLDDPMHAFSKRLWSVSAGAKSIFMLPKISSYLGFSRLLKDYKLNQSIRPKTLFEHSSLFTEIAKKTQNKHKWYCDVLFFSKKWFEPQENINWFKFHYHLIKKEWRKSLYWRNKVTFEILKHTFADEQQNKNLSPNQYLIDTVMHLIDIAIGVRPGFAPVTKEEVAPITNIQNAFIESYKLKQYIPTTISVSQFSKTPIYYSMNHPTILITAAKLAKPHSLLDDLCMVKRLLLVLKDRIQKDNVPIYNLIKNLEFNFYHTESYPEFDIKPTNEIPNIDERFKFSNYNNNKNFCSTAPFMKGCIMIRKL